jgi:uncharacterized membrane protein YccC
MAIPIHIWAYAFRIWLAAAVALYVAFWLELGGASTAASTLRTRQAAHMAILVAPFVRYLFLALVILIAVLLVSLVAL